MKSLHYEKHHSNVSKDNRRIGGRCCCRLCLLRACRLFEWFMCHYFEPMEQHSVCRCDGGLAEGWPEKKQTTNSSIHE